MKQIISCLLTLTLAACGSAERPSPAGENDQGTGFNTVEQQYAKSASETWDAAMSAVKSYSLDVNSELHDRMGGEILASRASGEKVTVRVQSLDDKRSQVSVRVEPGNRNLAEMLHEKIADNLGLKEAKQAFSGGNSCQGSYSQTLESCLKTAEDAARRLNLTVTNRELREGTALLAARDADSTDVQFKMKAAGGGTKITFIAGREKSENTRDLAFRMRSEFESGFLLKGN